jgi:hypothetical protein
MEFLLDHIAGLQREIQQSTKVNIIGQTAHILSLEFTKLKCFNKHEF